MLPIIPGWLLIGCIAGGLSAAAGLAGVQAADTGEPPPMVTAFPRKAQRDYAPTTQAAAQPTGREVPPAPHRGTTATDGREPWPKLLARLGLHVLATVFGLRAGMKIFYENAQLAGFVGVVFFDALVILGMALLAPATGGFTAMAGPQAIVSALVMGATLHYFGFSKDRFTVVMATVVAKSFGFLAELGLRLLFLDAILRAMADLRW